MSASTKTWLNNSAPSVEDDDLNGFKNENNNLIVGSGQSLNTGDLQQTHKAVSHFATVGQFFTGGGIADVYTLTAVAPRLAPPALTDGMIFRGIFPADNTGAATVNPFGLGVVNIKLAGGVTNPAAGQIKTARETVLIYRTSPSAHAELIQSGMVNIVTFTSSGTYTPAAGVKGIEITAIGAGGGSGGVDGQGAGTAAASGGGGGGGTSILATNNIEASYTITIGAAGTGGASGNNDGTAGGVTTVVSAAVSLTANGGGFGQGDLGVSGAGSADGGSGGTASGGDLNFPGSDGSLATVAAGDGGNLGDSGASIFGGGKRGQRSAPGLVGTVPGVGGSGSGSADATTDRAGANGADGEVIIREFF